MIIDTININVNIININYINIPSINKKKSIKNINNQIS